MIKEATKKPLNTTENDQKQLFKSLHSQKKGLNSAENHPYWPVNSRIRQKIGIKFTSEGPKEPRNRTKQPKYLFDRQNYN